MPITQTDPFLKSDSPMSYIYIIAGPPGVGKSTRGNEYIDPELEILNEDEIRHHYKIKGYADYNEYSLQKSGEQCCKTSFAVRTLL